MAAWSEENVSLVAGEMQGQGWRSALSDQEAGFRIELRIEAGACEGGGFFRLAAPIVLSFANQLAAAG